MWWMFRERDATSRQYVEDISSFMRMSYPKTFQLWSAYAGDHLAHLLQRRESMLMIDDVLTSLLKSGIFAVSVHDSFLVRAEDRDLVTDRIRESFPQIQVSLTIEDRQGKTRQLVRGTRQTISDSAGQSWIRNTFSVRSSDSLPRIRELPPA